MSHDADQIHPASPLRLQQSRRDGQVAKSQELAGAIHLVIATGGAWVLLPMVATRFQAFTGNQWRSKTSVGSYQVDDLYRDLGQAVITIGVSLLPLLILLMLAGVLSHMVQTGPIFVGKRVVPNPQQLSPANWFSRVFSLTSIVRGALSIPKFIFAVSVAGCCLWYQQNQVYELAALPFDEMVQGQCLFAIQVSFCVSVALLALSSIDFGLEWYSHHNRLKMTEQQLRDEQRRDNIDPMVQNRRKQFFRSVTSR